MIILNQLQSFETACSWWGAKNPQQAVRHRCIGLVRLRGHVDICRAHEYNYKGCGMQLEPQQPLSRKIYVAQSIVIVTLGVAYKEADVDICRPRAFVWQHPCDAATREARETGLPVETTGVLTYKSRHAGSRDSTCQPVRTTGVLTYKRKMDSRLRGNDDKDVHDRVGRGLVSRHRPAGVKPRRSARQIWLRR